MASGSTPRKGYPYPLETDTPDVAADIHALALALDGDPSRGAVSITTSESRTNIAYGTMPTPDQVTGIVLPTNGLIAVWYQAAWQESIAGSARAAIFLGSNQLQAQGYNNTSRGPQAQAAATNGISGAQLVLATYPGGLLSSGNSSYASDATTGQAVGYGGSGTGASDASHYELGGVLFTSAQAPGLGGPCYIFATAGTYTVSVQFKAPSGGSVTVLNRKLWVRGLSFS